MPEFVEPLHVEHTTDEFGEDRFFIADGNHDWIGEPFPTEELAAQAIDQMRAKHA